MMMRIRRVSVLYGICLAVLFLTVAETEAQHFGNFATDTGKSSIDVNELIPGGPGKDGIPSIDQPKFVAQKEVSAWLNDFEPVIALEVNGEVRAYPIQILIWHEIVNDVVGGEPVLVTFCPLCYSAVTFNRTVNGEVHEFGVSGFLRHSDMVMYDRTTESLWQQFSGNRDV